MLPVCFIPCESMESPAAANTVTPASTRYLRKFTGSLSIHSKTFHHRVTEAQRKTRKQNAYKGFLCVSVTLWGKASWLRLNQFRRRVVAMLLHHLVSRRAQLQERLRFLVKTFAVIAVKCRLLQYAEHGLGPEIIFIIKAMHREENVVGGKPRILDVRQLVSAFIHHLVVAHHESVLHRIVVKLRARISMRHGNLNGFHVQFFGKRDRVVDRLVRL